MSWLVWHLTRVQDDHVAGRSTAAGMVGLGLGRAVRAAGRDDGHRLRSHRRRRWPRWPPRPRLADLLAEYHEATHAQTVKLVSEVTDADLDRIVDRRWTPPVTLAVRLVSVLDDDMQHAGQAAYVRGMLLRRG